MINIIVATHGPLAEAFIESAALIFGKQDNVKAIGLFEGDNIDTFKKKVIDTIQDTNNADGTLILTDILGGSPSNVAAFSLVELKDTRIECLAGLNLPIFIEALANREFLSLDKLIIHLIEAGKSSIINIKEELNNRR